MISVRKLSKRYGAVRALTDVDLEVGEGQAVVVAGPNGSGKTTLLKAIAGLVRPTTGSVEIDGRHPVHVRGRIGYVGHEPQLYPHLTVEENLLFFSSLYGADRKGLDALMESFGIDRKRSAMAGTLSRGEAQRAALCRALLHHPDVVIADEPFTGLDDSLEEHLPSMLHRTESTLVIALHETGRAAAFSARVVTLG